MQYVRLLPIAIHFKGVQQCHEMRSNTSDSSLRTVTIHSRVGTSNNDIVTEMRACLVHKHSSGHYHTTRSLSIVNIFSRFRFLFAKDRQCCEAHVQFGLCSVLNRRLLNKQIRHTRIHKLTANSELPRDI